MVTTHYTIMIAYSKPVIKLLSSVNTKSLGTTSCSVGDIEGVVGMTLVTYNIFSIHLQEGKQHIISSWTNLQSLYSL